MLTCPLLPPPRLLEFAIRAIVEHSYERLDNCSSVKQNSSDLRRRAVADSGKRLKSLYSETKHVADRVT